MTDLSKLTKKELLEKCKEHNIFAATTQEKGNRIYTSVCRCFGS